ncbi:hypothetical protein BC937DRAFT_93305 [Endogone sp. FLAS-F59071]|nr:hypothetical protein BC937DRAFT_93305 [Endogone sp. FLAS-F59071]|eukprot:RUS23361.1 hypothetical protein BC937DRAFT_93305 [Endogone sp. FLAS-F59071]
MTRTDQVTVCLVPLSRRWSRIRTSTTSVSILSPFQSRTSAVTPQKAAAFLSFRNVIWMLTEESEVVTICEATVAKIAHFSNRTRVSKEPPARPIIRSFTMITDSSQMNSSCSPITCATPMRDARVPCRSSHPYFMLISAATEPEDYILNITALVSRFSLHRTHLKDSAMWSGDGSRQTTESGDNNQDVASQMEPLSDDIKGPSCHYVVLLNRFSY